MKDIVILLEKSILNGIGKGRKEMEDGGKFSLGVIVIFLEKRHTPHPKKREFSVKYR